LRDIWQGGAWVVPVLRLSSGFDAIFPVLSKHLSNNGWYFDDDETHRTA